MVKDSMEDDIKLLTKVCYMYYHEDKVQTEIADQLGITRQTVSRLLQKSRDEGIVKISIQSPVVEAVALETQLEEKFNLKNSIVIQKDYISNDQLIEKLGMAAAEYLFKVIASKMRIGIGFGKSIEFMAEYINDHFRRSTVKDVQIVQMVGNIKSNLFSENSQYIASLIAKKMQASTQLLHAPFCAEDDYVRAFFLNDSTVQNVLEQLNHLDYAFVEVRPADRVYPVSIKKMKPANISYLNFLGINYLSNLDVVGEICLNYFNDRGHFVDTRLSEYLIGINAKQLLRNKNIVGIAGGNDNQNATLGALKTGAINVLITDEDTAKFILSMN